MTGLPKTDRDDAPETFEFLAKYNDKNVRLDKFVAGALPDLSRTYLQELIEQGAITVDGQIRRSAFKMTPGQRVLISVPETEEIDIRPENISLDILFEDPDVLVINKPAGLVVHPAPGHPTGTLVNAVLHHVPDIAIGGTNRPGIVHRLDKDTSGVMVIAKTDRAQQSLVAQWQTRTVVKEYVALVAGVIEEEEATIDAPIARDPGNRQRMTTIRAGKDAVSHIFVTERFPAMTLVRIGIETGRTHQIRVHLAFIKRPIVGDVVYGNERTRTFARNLGLNRQFLHASRLEFALPDGTGMAFSAPLPPDLAEALDLVRSEAIAE